MALSVILPVLELSDYHRGLTDFAIKNLRATADNPFTLIVVETGGQRLESVADVHVHRPERTCYTTDFNAAMDVVNTSHVVQTANDIVMERGWDTALWEPFERFSDCGASTLLSDERRQRRGNHIEEGFFGPVMCFSSEWRLDDAFPNLFSDTDLVMRMYRAGFRMYRNCRVGIRHIGGGEQTWRDVAGAERPSIFGDARRRFHDRHQDSGLLMFRALYEGWAI